MGTDRIPPSGSPARDTAEPAALMQLRRAIAFVPVPSRRPGHARADEVSGLTMLELSLRLDHITRASEHLQLFESGHLRRSVSVDVDLRRLTEPQRRALAVREPARPCPDGRERRDDGRPGHPEAMLWIPIARQSRDHQAPVTISDHSGAVVPRLTTLATERTLIAGMSRLLHLQIAAQSPSAPAARPADPAAPPLLDVRARWLLERAMAHLIRYGYDAVVFGDTDGAGAGAGSAASAVRPPPDGADLALHRARALAYLDGLPEPHRQELAWLLEVAAREQLLVAMVPASTVQTHLTFQAPLLPARARSLTVRQRVRRWIWTGRDLTVTYCTQVPRIVRSYHLSVEVPEEIHVRRFLLVTDADRSAVDYLIHDLRQLARDADRYTGHGVAVYRAELQDALARCAALARRRTTDVVHYGQYLEREFRQFGDRAPAVPRLEYGATELVDDLIYGRCTFWHLRSLAYHHERGDLTALGYRRPEVIAGALDTLAGYLERAGLAHDVALDNDPRENGSHTYWANVELPFGPRPTEPVEARVHLDLADEPPALIGSVTRMVAGLLGVVLLLDVLGMHTDDNAFTQSDAAVTVLLLVPGILLSRLDIPGTHSVLGLLRAYPRRIAYLSVGVTSALSVVIATALGGSTHVLHAGVAALAVLLALCCAQIVSHGVNRRALAPDSDVVPPWLAQAVGVPAGLPARPADLQFDAVLATSGPELTEPWKAVRLLHHWRRAIENRRADRHRRRVSADATSAGTARDGLVRERRHAGVAAPAHPIETVTAAARSAGEGAAGVTVVVAHRYATLPGAEVAGAFAPPLPQPGPGLGRPPASAFGITLYGTTCEVSTAIDTDPRRLQSPTFLTSPLAACGGPGWSTVRATTRVSSNYPAAMANVNEILVQLGDRPDLGRHQSLMLGHVLARLTRLAAELDAVLVSLHSPVASPVDDGAGAGRRRPGSSVGPSIRIGLSNSREHGDARIAFEAQTCRIARDLGLGAYLSAGRAGFGTGTWTPVVPFAPELYREARAGVVGDTPDGEPAEQVLLTLVGPSAPSGPRDLADLTQLLRATGAGVHALSTWQEHQASFVHLLLARRSTEVSVALDDVHERPLPFLLDQCGTPLPLDASGVAVGGVGCPTLRWPEALSVLIANVAPLSRPREGDGQSRVVPLWTAWDLPDGVTGVDGVTRCLLESLRALDRPAWLTYVRARSTDRDRWRGRAKVSVQVPDSWFDEEASGQSGVLGVLAKRVQETTVTALQADLRLPAHAVSLHVAWGERWLGRPVDW